MSNNYLITGYWGEPHVTAENDRGIHAAAFGKGKYVLPVGEEFRAEYIGNNTVRMYDGKLMDNGAAAGIPAGEYIDFLIPNASQDATRYDYIVFQYSRDESTLVERGEFVLLQGVEGTESGVGVEGTAKPPDYTTSDLLSGNATFDQFPLWTICIKGTEIVYVRRRDGADVSKPLSHCAADKSIKLTDCDYAISNGWYYFDRDTRNKPIFDNGGEGCLMVYEYADVYPYQFVQQAVDLKTGCKAQRIFFLNDNNILKRSGWEYENPFMAPNFEYCTTERWLGKPVYIKQIGCGSMPGTNATKNIGHGISNMEHIVDFGGVMTKNGSGAISLPYYFAAENRVWLSVTNENFVIVSGSNDVSSYNDVRLWVKYTKTTD